MPLVQAPGPVALLGLAPQRQAPQQAPVPGLPLVQALEQRRAPQQPLVPVPRPVAAQRFWWRAGFATMPCRTPAVKPRPQK